MESFLECAFLNENIGTNFEYQMSRNWENYWAQAQQSHYYPVESGFADFSYNLPVNAIKLRWAGALNKLKRYPWADTFNLKDGNNRMRLSDVIYTAFRTADKFNVATTFRLFDCSALTEGTTAQSFLYNYYIAESELQGKTMEEVIINLMQAINCYLINIEDDYHVVHHNLIYFFTSVNRYRLNITSATHATTITNLGTDVTAVDLKTDIRYEKNRSYRASTYLFYKSIIVTLNDGATVTKNNPGGPSRNDYEFTNDFTNQSGDSFGIVNSAGTVITDWRYNAAGSGTSLAEKTVDLLITGGDGFSTWRSSFNCYFRPSGTDIGPDDIWRPYKWSSGHIEEKILQMNLSSTNDQLQLVGLTQWDNSSTWVRP